jgi:hypothetical protein
MFLEVIYNDQTIDKNFESMALLWNKKMTPNLKLPKDR